MQLSVVTTLYKSEGTVAEFIARAGAAAAAITPDYEIVLVDDGSPDASLQIAVSLAKADPRLKVVELSRNFGHHKALMTGLQHAGGDHCFLIDSDLEEPPELLERFWALLAADEQDVIYGFQTQRGDGFFRRLCGRAAYRVFDWLLSAKVPTNHLTVRLMTRAYVDALLLHRETQLVIGGIWVITGFRQAGVAVNKANKGTTTYSFLHRWRVMLDSVTNFSETPLIAIFYIGSTISFGAGALAVTLLMLWLLGGVAVAGWVSVMLSVWFIGGLGIFFIGILGLYLSKIFIETKNRPLTIVRRLHQSGRDRGSEP